MSVQAHTEFLDWLTRWEANLPLLDWDDVAAMSSRTAVISQDMIKGFCDRGALASPRAASIVPAVVRLFREAYDRGVRDFLLFQDAHDANALEFEAYPPHCIADTEESETIDELTQLPFSDRFVIFTKNSINSAIGTSFYAWLERHPPVNTFLIVGVCTDICVYQVATYLRARANEDIKPGRVIVLADCVQTYDLPVKEAEAVGALPHDGDLLHRLGLYHMALNGIEVVRAWKEER